MNDWDREPPAVTTDEVRGAVAAVLRVAPSLIGDDTNLVDLGLDSLRMMRLTGRWRRGGRKADFHVLTAEPTVRAWARHLNDQAVTTTAAPLPGSAPLPAPGPAEDDGPRP
ncbi:phosphopantetheine-binding protein [Actinacidiphila acidipaludis]|uniref:Phosphopantetheine-binding protein n=1 Tax=Actinacidiphila acidipaludis TaxID=2873382 RepID=A0ABS7QBE7_9ACTN|nr:phosphopantetheine-binding protein [Streptomyces acidipaludis]MBY8880278.1 phosphopantetheine-binding protein [Streptomyces acidipaludis]